jgi:hypothetical protein
VAPTVLLQPSQPVPLPKLAACAAELKALKLREEVLLLLLLVLMLRSRLLLQSSHTAKKGGARY